MALGTASDDDGAQIVDATISAFNKSQLSSLLRFKGGMVLEDEVNTDAPFRRVAEDLVTLLQQNDDVDRFISLALSERDHNPKLLALAQARGIAPPEPPPPPAAGGAPLGTVTDFLAAARKAQPDDPALAAIAAPVGAEPAAPSANLEALVARRSRLIDFARFQQRLDQIEARVCLVQTPKSAGTGFLVGPDLLLTNYHVVEGLIGGGYSFEDVVCEFDFNSATAQPRRVALSGGVKTSAPYSQSDLTGQGAPAEGELDYALLPLSERVGEGARGFYTLDPVPRLLTLGDFVFVCQHAEAQALRLAMGTITDFPGKATRIRYDVTTGHGSSGSPCFSAELDPIGLHHAADPAQQPRYNQAVPLWLIARHAKAAGGLS
jgi:hypothetical protein